MAQPFRNFLGALFALGLTSSALAQAGTGFDQVVVLGDSLSDMGNAGRASNGPVWVEHLAARLKLELKASQTGGFNFAVGGARLAPGSGPSSLRAQADLLLRRPPPPDRTLYVVYGGGNDILAEIESSDPRRRLDAAVASLADIAADLVKHGARHLLLPNLPDIGITPAVRSRGTLAVEQAGRLTEHFNAGLERAVASLASSAPPELRIYRLDVRDMAERVRHDPGALDFKDVVTPCRALPSCEGYLFWDEAHPTTQAHRGLAEAAFRALLPEQVK